VSAELKGAHLSGVHDLERADLSGVDLDSVHCRPEENCEDAPGPPSSIPEAAAP
jgi:uncharacterized protein YjbI with pentapeptide repeats